MPTAELIDAKKAKPQSKLKNLQNDPKLDHPTRGQSIAAKLKADSRDSAIRAVVILMGRDRVLAEIARADGLDRALYVARHLNLNPHSFMEAAEARRQEVRQASRQIVGGWGPDHSEIVLNKIHQGRPAAEIQAARAEARAEAAAAAQARREIEARERAPITPLVQQATLIHGEGWGDDPQHSPAVVEAILRGASIGEIAALTQQARREIEARKKAPPAPEPRVIDNRPATQAEPAPPSNESTRIQGGLPPPPAQGATS